MSDSSIAERWQQIQERVGAACRRVNRSPESVTVVAVSKKHPPSAVEEAARAGLEVFGENRVQEALAKMEPCSGRLVWHLIGHLQTNKVRPAVASFAMIHSVDSVRLLEAIEQEAERVGRQMPVCLQVNVSGEKSKFGMSPDELLDLPARVQELVRTDFVGLMTMPPFTPDPEQARPYFRELRHLADLWQDATGFRPGLSMGMSHDFEVAIEEGADWVRIGTGIFGVRPAKREPAWP